ncbi:HNH endonuclease [Comamonas sp.]|uniref:HNH endonuclease n=1 Tax=Comamonas sp. TaxID=34028 RepID=UPI00289F34E5|nr:HNH endonuclease [Comamonas sp.]
MAISAEVVEQVLQERGYRECNRTTKKVAYQWGDALPVYVNLQSKQGTTALVAHPDSDVEVVAGAGVMLGGQYFHSSNMGLFPKRMHKGVNPIPFGIGLTLESQVALGRCLDFLEQGAGAALQAPTSSAMELATTRMDGSKPPVSAAAEHSGSSVVFDPELLTKGWPLPAAPLLEEDHTAGVEGFMPAAPGQDVWAQTTRRMGHDGFRRALEQYWGGACAFSGVANAAVLRASHIKPWSVCEPGEQTNIFNGVLLAAQWDAAFDRGLITLDTAGRVLLSPQLAVADAALLGIEAGMRLRKPLQPQQQVFMAYHRQHVFLAV